MGKINVEAVPVRTGTIYPPPLDREVAGRSVRRLGEAGGLTQFGVNLVTLAVGAKSSMRHWHRHEDEFVMVVDGELMLVQDGGEVPMRAGDCAAFPAGDPDGHCLVNRSDREARFLVVGTRAPREVATYSDIDLMVEMDQAGHRFTRKDGSPVEAGSG